MVRIGQTVLGEKGAKICVPIVGTTVKEILDATAVACNTPCDVVELRIDYYGQAHSIDAIIELLMLMKPQLKGRGLLFTWRTKGEGGGEIYLLTRLLYNVRTPYPNGFGRCY